MFLILPLPLSWVDGSQELKSNIRKGKHYAVKILLIAIWHENFNRRNYVYNRTNLTIVRRSNFWCAGARRRVIQWVINYWISYYTMSWNMLGFLFHLNIMCVMLTVNITLYLQRFHDLKEISNSFVVPTYIKVWDWKAYDAFENA